MKLERQGGAGLIKWDEGSFYAEGHRGNPGGPRSEAWGLPAFSGLV